MMSSDSDFDSDVTIDPNEDRVISDVDSDTDTAGISRSVHVGSTVKGNLRNNTSMNSVHAISDSESSEDDIKTLHEKREVLVNDTPSPKTSNKLRLQKDTSSACNKPTTSRLKKSDTINIESVQNSHNSTKRRNVDIVNIDKRPHCKYGNNCYRKNPSHHKDYQHPNSGETSSPAPKKPRLSESKSSTSHRKTETPDRRSVTATATPSKEHPRQLKLHKRTSSVHTKQPTTPDEEHNTKSTTPPKQSGKHSATASQPSPGTSKSTNDSQSIGSDTQCLTAAEVFERTKPLGFLLTKVSGINDSYNDVGAISLKDILSPSMGTIKQSAQFNYMFEIPWLVAQYPVEFRRRPLTLIHGFQRNEKRALESDAKPFTHITCCQANLEIMYGTHHTKMMFILYESGLRVVIHTANLIQRDWHQKTQGVWISKIFPLLDKPSSLDGDSRTNFKRDLLAYVMAYKKSELTPWINIIREHNMSSARVYIIGSVPGRHTGENRALWGHMKLRKVLTTRGPEASLVKSWPVVGQYSSIGSLGPDKNKWLCSEFFNSLATVKGLANTIPANTKGLKLIYPSKHNVRLSLEGYPGGMSLPYSIETASKQRYLHEFFHQWVADISGRSTAIPHIKTYLRISPDSSKLAWFMVTSANLSKAAWGAREKDGVQQMIRSYEIGVLFLPQYFGKSSFTVGRASSSHTEAWDGTFPVPYDLPLTEYQPNDKPWIWNIPHLDKPDSHGNKWCPDT